MMEEWLPIPGYTVYAVSSKGRVYSEPRAFTKGGYLKPALTGKYLSVVLLRDGERKTLTVHSLVALAFLGQRTPGKEVDHIDGAQTNNDVCNLRYLAKAENAVQNRKRGEENGHSVLTEDQVHWIRASHLSSIEMGAWLGVDASGVRRIRRGETWVHLLPKPSQQHMHEIAG